MAKRIEFTKTNKKCTQNLKYMLFIKKLLWRVDKITNIKKKLKIWSEEVIDTLSNCFQSHECKWNVTGGDYKDQNRKSLPLEEFDMSVQEYNGHHNGDHNCMIIDIKTCLE